MRYGDNNINSYKNEGINEMREYKGNANNLEKLGKLARVVT
jgi:hypothetical protein